MRALAARGRRTVLISVLSAVALTAANVLAARGRGESACAGDDIILLGRVVDPDGEAVSGASVVVRPDPAPVPARGYESMLGASERPVVVRTAGDGRFSVARGVDPTFMRGHTRLIVAYARGLVSEEVEAEIGAAPVDVGNLTLGPTMRVAVQVRDPDGGAMPDADVVVSLSAADGEGTSYSWAGRTDAHGALVLDVVPRRRWRGPMVTVKCGPDRLIRSGDDVRVRSGGDGELVLEVSVPRAIRMVGRITDAKGNAAAGLLVYGTERGNGDPRIDALQKTDGAGRFQLVGAPGSLIVVCLDLKTGECPILAIRAPASKEGVADVGEVRLPEWRTVRFGLVDAGGAPLRGSIAWGRADIPHGAGAFLRTGVGGTADLEGIVAGAPYEVLVSTSIPTWGEVEESFAVQPRGWDPVTLRVTGRGTVIARLRRADPALPVRDPRMDYWNSETVGGTSREGVVTEIRAHVGFGDLPLTFRFRCTGAADVTVHGVRMRSDAPTTLDVIFK